MLKALQVKAELNKLGEAPRAYLDKLVAAEDNMTDMSQPGQGGSKLSLNERFEKIQGARPTPKGQQQQPGPKGPNKTLRYIPRPKIAASNRN